MLPFTYPNSFALSRVREELPVESGDEGSARAVSRRDARALTLAGRFAVNQNRTLGGATVGWVVSASPSRD